MMRQCQKRCTLCNPLAHFLKVLVFSRVTLVRPLHQMTEDLVEHPRLLVGSLLGNPLDGTVAGGLDESGCTPSSGG